MAMLKKKAPMKNAPKKKGLAPETRSPRKGATGPNQIPKWGRIVAISVGLIALFAVLAYLFPVRSYIHQQNRISAAEKQLVLLRTQTKILRDQKQLLESPAEIERIARARFGMVKPGEQAWAVVPGSTGAAGGSGATGSTSP
jgi:cell division protein FtsB